MTSEEYWNKWKIARRIATDGYPTSEARYDNLLEYICALENKLGKLKIICREE